MEWKTSEKPVPYDDALAFMDARASDIHNGTAPECVWLLEHPPLYTAGTSSKESDLLNPRFPVFKTGRGGQYTYHGPGQRVAYVMLNLRKRSFNCTPREGGGLVDPRLRGESTVVPDIKKYVWNLEQWIIRTLEVFGLNGDRRAGEVGIWVSGPSGDKKIAAIGVRVRRWVTMHGVSINVNPDLSHYDGIVPCGIADKGVTSMHDLGAKISIEELDRELKKQFSALF